jgi:hypothetical protein
MEKYILAIGYYHHGQTIILTGEKTGEKMNTNIKQTNTQHREIPISLLPECYYKEMLAGMVEDPNKATVYVVARMGVIGDWSAYIGWPELKYIKGVRQTYRETEYYCTSVRTPKQVAAYGDKLDRQTAEQLFPEWKDRRYRE